MMAKKVKKYDVGGPVAVVVLLLVLVEVVWLAMPPV
jgi:hypothetical protein